MLLYCVSFIDLQSAKIKIQISNSLDFLSKSYIINTYQKTSDYLLFFRINLTQQYKIRILAEMNEQKRQYMSFAYMTMAQILFPASYIYASQQNLQMAEVNLFRSIVLMLICLFIAKRKQIDLQKSIRVNFHKFLVRNIAVLIHAYAIFLCHYYLSVSAIHTINSIGPLIVFIWDYFIYGITINRRQFLGIIVGISGMLLTVNAASIYLLFDSNFQTGSTFQHYRSTDFSATLIFSLFLAGANIFWAYSVSMVKSIKMKDSSEMNFHLALLLLFSSGIHYIFCEIQTRSLEIYVGIVLFTSITLGIGQVLFVASLTLTRNTGILTLFVFVSIIVGYFFSLVRYNQNVNPIAVIGSLLIIFSLAMVVLCKDKTPAPSKQNENK